MSRYTQILPAAATRCLMDSPRTRYAAAKELRGMGVQIITRGERQWIVRTIAGEGLAILRNARSWSAS
jgi:hypothetical protein